MCIATARNMTMAMKIRDTLARSSVKAEIVSVDVSITRHGCAYGVSFDCAEEAQVKRVLRLRRVDYGEIIGGNSNRYER